ncbi:MAG: DUF2231 domain-containing protein [Bdellovibrionota bacterium]
MQEIPLHPALVHIPIGIAFILPFFAIAATIALWRGWVTRRTWLALVALQAFAFGGAFAAVNTGEREEERVEETIGEAAIETHEERAEAFLWIAGIGLTAGLATAFLRPGKIQNLAAAGTTGLAVLLAASAFLTGHSGGELVYQHGAARAYASTTGGYGTSEMSDGGQEEGKTETGIRNQEREEGEEDDD